MNEHRPEVADVFRTYEKDFFAKWGPVLGPHQRKAFEAIRDCRTAALGGHVERVEQCDTCGHLAISYNSCRNRHCPKCQAASRAQWLAARQAELLPVPYFHVVFTLPQKIGMLALQNAREIYRVLFRAASETLLTIAADPKHLGARIGFLAVLHTWGQNLHFHPHLHCVIPGGGLSADDSRWISCRRQFLFPVKALSRLFRTKFASLLKRVFHQAKLRFHGKLQPLAKNSNFFSWLNEIMRSEWVVYAKPPSGGPQQVVKYVERYTHCVAISSRRLVALQNGSVTFRWKDYAHGNQPAMMTLQATEFIRRFLLHVLPKGLVRIRHFGFLANRCRRQKISLCRKLLDVALPTKPQASNPRDDSLTTEQEAKPIDRCPVCKVGRLRLVEILLPEAPMVARHVSPLV